MPDQSDILQHIAACMVLTNGSIATCPLGNAPNCHSQLGLPQSRRPLIVLIHRCAEAIRVVPGSRSDEVISNAVIAVGKHLF
jgi:hypothetical protein